MSPFCGKALALVPLAIPRHIPSLLSFIAGTEAIRSTVAQTIHSPRRSALTRAQTWARARATDLGGWLLVKGVMDQEWIEQANAALDFACPPPRAASR